MQNLRYIEGFIDSNKFAINSDGIPCYITTGTSYLEKTKNKISFHESYQEYEMHNTICYKLPDPKQIQYQLYVDIEFDDCKIQKLNRLGKRVTSFCSSNIQVASKLNVNGCVRQHHNEASNSNNKRFKKNKTKQNGYTYKNYEQFELNRIPNVFECQTDFNCNYCCNHLFNNCAINKYK